MLEIDIEKRIVNGAWEGYIGRVNRQSIRVFTGKRMSGVELTNFFASGSLDNTKLKVYGPDGPIYLTYESIDISSPGSVAAYSPRVFVEERTLERFIDNFDQYVEGSSGVAKAAAQEALDAKDQLTTDVGQAINELNEVKESNRKRYLDPVATVAERDSAYPTPQNGDSVWVSGEGKMYRYNGTEWKVTNENDPSAIDMVNQQLAEKADGNDLEIQKSRIDNLIINEGVDSSAEVVDSRVDLKGKAHDLLGQRLNADYQNVQTSFSRKMGIPTLTNLIRNGDFKDYDGNGIADNWFFGENTTNHRVEAGKQYWTSTSGNSYTSAIQSEGEYRNVAGRKYYVAFISDNVDSFNWSSTTSTITDYVTGNGFHSSIIEPSTSTYPTNSLYRIRLRPRTDGEVSISKFVLVDLTDAFGAGNEPALSEMNDILNTFPNSWFEDTETLFNASNLMESTDIALNKASAVEEDLRKLNEGDYDFVNDYLETSNFTSAYNNRTRIVNYETEKDETISLLKINAHRATTLHVKTFKNEGNNTFTEKSSTPVEVKKIGEQIIPVNIQVPAGHYIGFYSNQGIVRLTPDERSTYFTFNGETTNSTPTQFVRQTDAYIGFAFAFKDISTRMESITLAVNELKNSGGFQEELSPGSSPFPAKPVIEHGKRPLYIEGPYGYNQPFHPSVEYFESGWNGWKYWMAYSPYPINAAMRKDRYENPVILVSNDGISWRVPNGLTNPIDELTQKNIDDGDYMSDPDLVFVEETNTLECWYRITYKQQNDNTLIVRKTTVDGVNWSAREVMIDSWFTEKIRSQSLIRENGKYKMWFTGDRRPIGLGESVDGFSWEYTTCTFNQGSNPWHIDAGWDETKNNYYLINYIDADKDVLNYYTSVDGINWNYVKDLLRQEEGTFWDRRLYRSSAVYNGKEWSLYFTCEQDSNLTAALGLMKGPSLDALEVVDGGYNLNRGVFRQGIRLDNTKYIQSDIILADTGEKIGFDYETKSLYFQRADGTRVVIAK